MNTHTEQEVILAVCDYYEAEGIMESTGKIAEQVNSWYRNTDITDVKVLAAAVMEYGFYTSLPDYNELLQVKNKIGNIVDTDGKILGQHNGIWNYTIGQRKGLGVASTEALYVLELRKDSNEVVVGFKDKTMHNT